MRLLISLNLVSLTYVGIHNHVAYTVLGLFSHEVQCINLNVITLIFKLKSKLITLLIYYPQSLTAVNQPNSF